MHFTIDRSKWRTGGHSENKTGEGGTALLNKEGFMCCLGFMSLQQEDNPATEDMIRNYGWPCNVEKDHPSWKFCLAKETAGRFTDVNDSRETTAAQKESLITGMLAVEGHTVTFVN